MLTLDPQTTALILIDLQKGILAGKPVPHTAADVVATCKTLAARFRTAGAPVVLVNVDFGKDLVLAPSQLVDNPMGLPEGGMPPSYSELTEGLVQSGDILVTKHHWGAFTGTKLDLELRRRRIRTLVIAGVSTNFGVESTARTGWELGYDVVIAEDGCSSRSAALHAFSIENILPQIARIAVADNLDLNPGASP